jgi:hypothetical protein
MSRVPDESKRGWSAGQPRPGTAKAELLAYWRKLSDYDRRQALRELAADLKARRANRGREP